MPAFVDWLIFLRKHDVTTLASPSPPNVMGQQTEIEEEAEERGDQEGVEEKDVAAEEGNKKERGVVHQKEAEGEQKWPFKQRQEEEEGGRGGREGGIQRAPKSARRMRITSRQRLEMGVGLLVFKSQWPKRATSEESAGSFLRAK